MITLFRKTRQYLLGENKFTKYVLYAIGEIVLVVIGILIALQINNNNDIRKARNKEVHYLENIKTDLHVSIQEMDSYLAKRRGCMEAAQRILNHFNGEPITDMDAFNDDGVRIYSWQKFYQNNNTFQELTNSGNLALISNDSIKNALLNIEALYKKMKSEEDHFRYDSEQLIFTPLYALMDLDGLVNNFEYRYTKGKIGKEFIFPRGYFDEYLKSLKLKNGFAMVILEFRTMNYQMEKMKRLSEELIALIDREIDKK